MAAAEVSSVMDRLKEDKKKSGGKLPLGEYQAKVIGFDSAKSKAGNMCYRLKVRFAAEDNAAVDGKERMIQWVDDPNNTFILDKMFKTFMKLGINIADYNGIKTKQEQHDMIMKHLRVIEDKNPRFLVEIAENTKNPQWQNHNIVMKSLVEMQGFTADESFLDEPVSAEAEAPAAPAAPAGPTPDSPVPKSATAVPAEKVAIPYWIVGEDGKSKKIEGWEGVQSFITNGYEGLICENGKDWETAEKLGFSVPAAEPVVPDAPAEPEAPLAGTDPEAPAEPSAPANTPPPAGAATGSQQGIAPAF
jgi:hypothetical protein